MGNQKTGTATATGPLQVAQKSYKHFQGYRFETKSLCGKQPASKNHRVESPFIDNKQNEQQ